MAIRKNVVALSIGKHQEHFFNERAVFFSRKNAAFVGIHVTQSNLSKNILKQFRLTFVNFIELNRFCFSSLTQFHLWFFFSLVYPIDKTGRKRSETILFKIKS